MGTIIQATRQVGERYNKIRVYRGSGNVTAGGWGVRARDQVAGFEDESLICTSHPLRHNTSIKYLSFRILDVGVPATDYLSFGIWKKTMSTNLTRHYPSSGATGFVIDEAVIKENYGPAATFVAGTEYTIMLPTPVYLPPESGTEYIIGVYASGCTLDYDIDGEINGARIPNVGYPSGIDINTSTSYALSDLDFSDWALSFEAFSEPDSWVRQLKGGAISEENDDWHNALYCTAHGPGPWANPEFLYGAGVAVSAASGNYILIDLGAGLVPLVPWPGPPTSGGSIPDEQNFPDYAAYGVRCLHLLDINCEVTDVGDPGALEILISDQDTDTPPAYGYEPIQRLTTGVFAPLRIEIPSIARWIKIAHSDGSDPVNITSFMVFQIQHRILDGNFPVDVLTVDHHAWIENYPTQEVIRRATFGNMAGAESLPGRPFTNRENID